MENPTKILYVQTSGVEASERSATVFFLSTAAASMDLQVGIYFTQFGPSLLKKGVAEQLRIKKGSVGQTLFCNSSFFINCGATRPWRSA